MDFGTLAIFVAVAETGSISQAARRLGYVQSNVSARIQHLEDDLATPLFYRKKRGIEITPAGRTLLPYATHLLRLAHEARRAVQQDEPGQGSLAIGAMETTAAVRLPPILGRYHQAYPAVDLTLQTGPSEDLIARVLAYRLDGAFVGGAVAHPELDQEVLFEEELCLVSAQGIASLDELTRDTILVFRQGCTYRARLEQWLRTVGLVPYTVMEFGTVEAILGCVAAGMGITFFPRRAVEQSPYRDTLRLHPAPDAFAQVPTMFVRRHDTLHTSAMEAFLALARQAATGDDVQEQAYVNEQYRHVPREVRVRSKKKAD